MAITVDLPPEVERALRAAAEAQGRDPVDVLRDLVEQTYAQERTGATEPGTASESWYDLLNDHIGRIEGSGEAFSEDCGERFTDHLIEKREQGHL